MWVGVERRGDERSVRSCDGIMAGLDRDFSAIETPAEAHLALGYFQPGVMASRDQTERRAHYDDLGLRCHEDERAPGRLLLQRSLHRSVIQLHARAFFVRLIDDDAVPAKIETCSI